MYFVHSIGHILKTFYVKKFIRYFEKNQNYITENALNIFN